MTDFHAYIEVRAYFLAEAAGWPEGQHEAHWLDAEEVELRIAAAKLRHAEECAAAETPAKAKRSAAAKKAAATRKANKATADKAAKAALDAWADRAIARDHAARPTAVH